MFAASFAGRRKGYKLSLIIFVVVFFSVAATFALNTIVGYETQKKSLTNNTLELNRITANELSRTTQTIILNMQDTLKAASEHLAEESWDSRTIQEHIDFLRKSVPYFNSVVLVDKSGVVMSTSPEALNVKGKKLTSAQTRQALELKKPLISAPYRAVTGRMIVMASYPVYRSGEYAGFLAGSIYLQEQNVFQRVLGQQGVNENGSFYYVVDAAGNLIFHPDKNRIGENVSSNPAVASIMKGQGGEMPIRYTLGMRFLAGFSVVPAVGWGIISQTPAANVESSVGEVVWRMALISAPLMILLLLLVVLIANRLAAPLNRLAMIAAKLNRGEASAEAIPEVKHWNYEANELYRAVSGAFRMLNKRAEDFSNQAHTDTLTGLTNRRLMDAIVEQWVGQGVPFSVIMLDLGRFKSVNDTYGHQKGDEVLRFLADLMRAEKRDSDYCCRYGGEEFAILMPYASEQQAYELAERIRMRTESAISPTGKAMTLSLGISTFPLRAGDAESLFKQADDALYQAKESGRNRTVVYRPRAVALKAEGGGSYSI
ncbi:sensor domain-containing diguanylate cyclase [Cohnella xylanilytica]|uniref:sensor domain-containing diguanylate cyclase n=1 Tax=Cohnella xylanilytica TaxID=557555 RepID=UPI001B1DCD28|nr:sensor domain-containing diguanylate cyclase [Cohnella xylanilytica]GIO13406.1 sensor domain-containing diguanylate cyclase [Cohnella xylanilytica]